MNNKTESPIRRWHLIALLIGVWVIAVGILCFTWVIAQDMGTPYRIPGSIMEAVEPRILSGNDAEVLTYCERHLAYHPDDVQVQWYQAVALHRLGQEAEAEKEFKAISGVDTNWSEYIKTYVEWLGSDARRTLGTQDESTVSSEGTPSESP